MYRPCISVKILVFAYLEQTFGAGLESRGVEEKCYE